MKKSILWLLTAVFVFGNADMIVRAENWITEPEVEIVSEGYTELTEENFPDEVFRQYLAENYDKDGDGLLSYPILSISIDGGTDSRYKGIKSLKGIEKLDKLLALHVRNTEVETVDLSANNLLRELELSNNRLYFIDLSRHPYLSFPVCDNNCYISDQSILDLSTLPGFDLSKVISWENAVVSGHTLLAEDESLPVSYNVRVNSEGLYKTFSISLAPRPEQPVDINAGNFPDKAFRLYLSDTYDEEKDGKLDAAHILSINLVDSEVSDVSGIELFPYLIYFNAERTKIRTLDFSQNVFLTDVNCDHNLELETMDVSKCIELKELSMFSDYVSRLDVSACTKLEYLTCYNNELHHLDLSNNRRMEMFRCEGNPLASFEIGDNRRMLEHNVCEMRDNIFKIEGSSLDLSTLPDLDMSKASQWSNASIVNGVLSSVNPKNYVSYMYDIGCGQNMMMTLSFSGENPSVTPTPSTRPEPTATPDSWPFIDISVNPGNWKYENIKFVNEKGIMTGVTPMQFQPDAPLTRAQFASVIYRMAGSPEVTYQNTFTDVSAGKWYSNAILWAYENKIVAGLGDGRYGINDNITREQMARMLMEFARTQGYDISARGDFGKFADTDQVSGWAAENMKWAVASGIISGSVKDGKYYMNPKGQATRAECAVMLTKFIKEHE